MPLTKCLRCERLFNKVESPICIACIPDEDNDQEVVRECINDNPGKNAEIIAELSGVDIKCVLRMIDEGSISSISEVDELSGFECGQCGQPAISASKRLCQSCLEKLNRKVIETRKSITLADKKETQVGVRDSLQSKRNR